MIAIELSSGCILHRFADRVILTLAAGAAQRLRFSCHRLAPSAMSRETLQPHRYTIGRLR